MKRVLLAILVIGVATAAWFGYAQYERVRLVEQVLPHVKNSSLRAENASRTVTDTKTQMTYKELFDRLEADIAEVEKRVLEVQTIATDGTRPITNPSIAYLIATQEYLRALMQNSRKTLGVESAIERATKDLESYKTASGYSASYAKERLDASLADSEKSLKDLKESAVALHKSAKELQTARANVQTLFPEDALIATSQIAAVMEKRSIPE